MKRWVVFAVAILPGGLLLAPFVWLVLRNRERNRVVQWGKGAMTK